MIRDITHGTQITETGAYRIPMDWYHSQGVCPGPSVSSTGLRKIVMQSPHAFWKTFEGNPNRYPPKPESDSLSLGKAAHCLVLGDEVFKEKFAVVFDTDPKRPTEDHIRKFEHYHRWPTADARERGEFWAKFDKENAGKTIVSFEDITKIQYMAENIAANPLCLELLRSDDVEISMVWQDPITGIWVKSRPDCLPTNGYDFGDLKTFAPKKRDIVGSVYQSIDDYGYDMQMALAIEGAEQVFGTTAKECGLVFIQTTEPYEAIPIRLDEDTLYWARVMCRHGLDTMAECLKTGDWYGAGKDLRTYKMRDNKRTRLAEMQADGLLPNIGAGA